MHRSTIPAVALMSSLALAGCSSSSDGGSAAAGGGRTSAAGSPRTSATTSAPVSGGSSDWCAELKNGNAIEALGGTSHENQGAFEKRVDKIVADAPAAVKPDVSAMWDIDKRILAGDTNAEMEFAQPANLQHIRRFATWVKTHCRDVDISVPDIPSAPTTP